MAYSLDSLVIENKNQIKRKTGKEKKAHFQFRKIDKFKYVKRIKSVTSAIQKCYILKAKAH